MGMQIQDITYERVKAERQSSRRKMQKTEEGKQQTSDGKPEEGKLRTSDGKEIPFVYVEGDRLDT